MPALEIKLLSSPAELFVLKNALVILVSYFVKIIHVELAHKRREVAMTEVYWQNFLLEPVDVQNCEIGTLFVPSCDIMVVRILSGWVSTSRISKVLEMNMEGPADLSLRKRFFLVSPLASLMQNRDFSIFFY